MIHVFTACINGKPLVGKVSKISSQQTAYKWNIFDLFLKALLKFNSNTVKDEISFTQCYWFYSFCKHLIFIGHLTFKD